MFNSLSDSDCSHSDSNHDSLEAWFLQLDDYLVAATTCNQLLNGEKNHCNHQANTSFSWSTEVAVLLLP